MKSQKPYLVRALYQWILDSEATPYVLVAVDAHSDIAVPREYVQDGKIVLNVSPTAVRNLEFGEAYMTFDGRFSGRGFLVKVPMPAIAAIYAKENGQGMMFDEPKDEQKAGSVDMEGNPSANITKANHLTVVK